MAGNWWTRTWSPIRMRCTRVSAGCDNCWHLRMADRHAANPTLSKRMREARAGGAPYLDLETLEEPLHWRKPQHVFTMGMGDLFHDRLTHEDQDMVRQIIGIAKTHTFYVVTKRPESALALFEIHKAPDNLWLGVSCEDQQTADTRIPILLQIPVAHRFVSLEPLLSDIKLRREWIVRHSVAGHDGWQEPPTLEFVIAGAETGPHARPANPEWFRRIRDDCAAAGVPFWLKQVDAKRNRRLDGVERSERP